jgi:hypothetical protein
MHRLPILSSSSLAFTRQDIRNMGYGVEPFFVPAVEGLEFDVDKFYNVRALPSSPWDPH